MICPDGESHTILWQDPQTTAGHPKDKDEVCIKCGKIIAELRWNGTYLERIKIN